MRQKDETRSGKFIEHLHNTIALLGGKDDILSILDKWANGENDEDALQQLMNWNMGKVDEIKNRLDRCSKRSVTRTHFN